MRTSLPARELFGFIAVVLLVDPDTDLESLNDIPPMEDVCEEEFEKKPIILSKAPVAGGRPLGNQLNPSLLHGSYDLTHRMSD